MIPNSVLPDGFDYVDCDAVADMAAFDALPPAIRRGLRETRYEISAEHALAEWNASSIPVRQRTSEMLRLILVTDADLAAAARAEGMAPPAPAFY